MLALLIDENFNQRILRGLRRSVPHLDYVVAQNIALQGSLDPAVLAWAAEHRRILVTHDLKTIPKHAYDRVKAGEIMPGVIAVPDTLPIGQAIEELALAAECAQPAELENLVLYLAPPLTAGQTRPQHTLPPRCRANKSAPAARRPFDIRHSTFFIPLALATLKATSNCAAALPQGHRQGNRRTRKIRRVADAQRRLRRDKDREGEAPDEPCSDSFGREKAQKARNGSQLVAADVRRLCSNSELRIPNSKSLVTSAATATSTGRSVSGRRDQSGS